MYSLEKIREAVANPRLLAVEANTLYHTRLRTRPYNPRGTGVLEEDWDQLIILDACRFDEFARRSWLPGDLEHRISRGSTTREFVRGNFTDEVHLDVVYISANGWFGKLREEINSELYFYKFIERTDEPAYTCRPETVTKHAYEAIENYPNKRFIIHYLQPHQPYLGKTGSRIVHTADLPTTVRENSLDKSTVLQGYRENLDLVLTEAEKLLEKFDGRTVVTADHGELLGERMSPVPVRRFGHPVGIYMPELVKVPWLINEKGERPELTTEESSRPDEVDLDRVEEQLVNLGYK